CVALAGQHEEFANLPADLEGSWKRWKEWAEHPSPEVEQLPTDWKRLGGFQQLLIMRAIRPDVEIIAVQAERAAPMVASLRSGEPETVESADTFADGLATKQTFEIPFGIVKGQVDDVVTVSEDEMKEGVRTALETTHNVAEGAAAAAYAAAEKLKGRLAGKRVVLVHTGQNIDRDTLRWALGLFDAYA
ncbi:MAG TPA: pyridoxal-phosphate dependent enzyme, partial [Polyangiaceae bacterium LLY-WYZ-15_(1-7)]|nr:pyridoxal-phosphate dependent enzyme [Polyangiaceae bacterium LLY-WYZ-15_(1-7)]